MPNRLKRHPIKAKNTEKGTVQVTKRQSESSIQPIVNNVLSKITSQTFCGSIAVLAKTNDEILQIATLLKKNGIYLTLNKNAYHFA